MRGRGECGLKSTAASPPCAMHRDPDGSCTASPICALPSPSQWAWQRSFGFGATARIETRHLPQHAYNRALRTYPGGGDLKSEDNDLRSSQELLADSVAEAPAVL